jgi:hypothetical protein
MILRNIPHQTRQRLDLFATIVPSLSRRRSADTSAIAAPRVCSSWRGPGTEALYERITIYSQAQCELLLRTLQAVPSLCPLVKVLGLPRAREANVVTPLRVLQLSADILRACKYVQEVDVMDNVSN